MANSAARSAIDVGTVIAGTYTIEALIGRGGMGAVFMASHARLPGKQVAIKVLHPDLAEAEVLQRFRREAEIAARLGHPNIVAVHDFNALPDGTPYLVLEYLEGENLAQRIKRGPIARPEMIAIVRQIGSALAAAHREGIVHRDLKPQNVFLVQTEVGGAHVQQVKVLDFGISKIRGSTTVKTQDSAMLGTPQYMAPEQALGKHADVDDRTDVFALGSMIYEMVCGQPAFVGASVPEVVFKVVYEEPVPLAERAPDVEPAIAAAVHKALAKKQDERFATINDFIVALTGEPLVRDSPGSAVLMSRSGRPVPVSTPPGDAKVSSAEALANTVGSGDHGEPPLAIAATQASGDHRASLLDNAAAVTVPSRKPPRRWGLIAGVVVVLAAAGTTAAVLATRDDPDPVATPLAAAVDAAVVAVVTPDAAVVVPVTVVADAAPVVVARIDARTVARAPKADAADDDGGDDGDDDGGGPGSDEPPIDPNQRSADQLFVEGRRILTRDPIRAARLGRRLIDTHGDIRGWVLRGAVGCVEARHDEITIAREKLAGDHRLLTQLGRICAKQLRR